MSIFPRGATHSESWNQGLRRINQSIYRPKTILTFQMFGNLCPKGATANDLVFFTRKGTQLQSETILKRIIHPACERLNLPKVGWHTLCHSSATLLHEHEPLRVAQAILGHSDLQTTLGYTHVLPGWQRDAMKWLEAVVLFPNRRLNQNRRIRNLLVRQRVKWRAQGDDFRTFLHEFVANLPQIEFPAGLGL